MENCIFCGAELVDGVCPNASQHFKPMCVNCTSCTSTEDGLVCSNETNMNNALEKIKTALPSGYVIKTLELAPVPLKDSTKKCKCWSLNETKMLNTLKSQFNG